MKPRPIEESSDLPDLTPMIDIVFLLIVFFMTVANMQVQQLVPIELPIAAHASIPDERGVRTTITIKSDGSLFFGSQSTTIAELPELVAQGKLNAPQLKVYVRADAQVPFKEVRKVFAAAAAGGVPNVIFATYQSAQ
ncbi:biopolymer transporter ExbD [Coraliomargarita sp. SDUM461003]|uniref:Biopolymer transporter ExbD n=1 Tax=Thalassobacterium maritimum TaxID=3041265 RepID=A0ABU1APD7_9BACT|nr:biopolymer transporter ExbD [Coraliomargarita sp. SDUM461003]MDQ8206036.1 biopolymer transporter ExbD [Coraliomargarita sp. SDUM461003]